MLTDSVELFGFTAAYVNRFFLVLVRVLAAISLNPILGSPRIPLPGRVGLGLVLAFALFPPGSPVGAPASLGPLEIAGEALVGLLAGFVVALAFAAVQFAASLLGVGANLNLAATLNPSADLGPGTLDQFFSIFAMLIFLQINGHHLVIASFHDLFRIIPAGTVPSLVLTPDALAAVTSGFFSAAIKMTLPALAALLLADVGMGILARVSPQLNLLAVGVPAKIALGLAALVVALPWMFPRLAAMFRLLPESILRVLS